MVLPEIIQTIKSLAEPTPSVDNHNPFAERDSVRANFCNNPSIENLNEIWGEIVYQHGIKNMTCSCILGIQRLRKVTKVEDTLYIGCLLIRYMTKIIIPLIPQC